MANKNYIQYITINSTGNATDFGDLTIAREPSSGNSNGINERGIFCSGTGGRMTLDYITINSTGNATGFGRMRRSTAGGVGGASDCGT